MRIRHQRSFGSFMNCHRIFIRKASFIIWGCLIPNPIPLWETTNIPCNQVGFSGMLLITPNEFPLTSCKIITNGFGGFRILHMKVRYGTKNWLRKSQPPYHAKTLVLPPTKYALDLVNDMLETLSYSSATVKVRPKISAQSSSMGKIGMSENVFYDLLISILGEKYLSFQSIDLLAWSVHNWSRQCLTQ